MRIVALSDTHGRHRQVDVPEGDVLIHAGDFTGANTLRDVSDFDDWFGQFDHPHKIVVAGNCDGVFETEPQQARDRLDSAIYLQDEGVDLEGIHVWGSPWQPNFMNLAFNLPRGEALADKWADMPEETDLLITHGPPRGILDQTSRGETVGDRALMERVRDVEPDLHVFGHVHESSGREQRGPTDFLNVACDRPDKSPIVVDYEP
jgi:Icc-related predicted phosphoesterase